MSFKALTSLAIVTLVFAAACGGDGPSKSSKKADPDCIDCEPAAGSSEVFVGEPSGELIEGGSPVTVVLKLKRQPEADVTVLAVGLHPDRATIEPGEFVFTPQTWSTSQLLTITAVDDQEQEDDEVAEIELTLVSDDTAFGGKPVNPLLVTVLDDDEPGSFVIESEDGLETTEAGGTVRLAITLSAQPGGDVLAPVKVDDEDEAEIDITQLQFTTLNWNIPQIVTVVGKDDLEADGDQTYNIVLGPTNSTEALFNNLPPFEFQLTNIDGVCGNSVVDGSEGCEPTGGEPTTCEYGVRDCQTCTDACQLEPGVSAGYCGDGVLQSSQGEQCEGPTEACDYGQMSCQTCAECRNVAGAAAGWCGDGVVQSQHEQCDPAAGACCNSNCTRQTPCQADCLIFSEYVEAAGHDKAIEIYNCEANKTIDLSAYEICMVKNTDTQCSSYHELSGQLAPGAVYTICHSQGVFPAGACDKTEAYVTAFNGDDRLVLFSDLNGDHKPGAGEPVADAFGEIAVAPEYNAWESKVYSRCNLAPYLGTGAFNLASYYETVHDCASFCTYSAIFDGLGVPPTQGCF